MPASHDKPLDELRHALRQYLESGRTERIAAYTEACMLSPEEQYWSSKRSLFASQGYQLRPRLQPGWVPPFATDEVRLSLYKTPGLLVRLALSRQGFRSLLMGRHPEYC